MSERIKETPLRNVTLGTATESLLPEAIEHTMIESEGPEVFVKPEIIERRVVRPFPTWLRFLRSGCYLIRYSPARIVSTIGMHYDGTLRVERQGTNTTASGDLYLHQIFTWPNAFPILEPNPATGIPIFARNRYRYYIRVTQILEWYSLGNSFTLGFELYYFDMSSKNWTNTGTFSALMKWTPSPPGYPSSSDYLTGEVKNSAGTLVGYLTMGWVSSYLRRATLEIDRVSASEWPLNNGAGIGWREIYDKVGWDVNIICSDSDVSEPSGESWSDAELHAAMLSRRNSSNLDTDWPYHVLCVRRIDSTPRGIMYDASGTDSNNVPREGAGISSHWIIPNTPEWGLVRNMRFGTATAPYFRTAVHEIGHAHLLYHNTGDLGIMNTTDVIAASATPPVLFPNNIQWSHHPDDQKRLRHLPDIWVRPGGIAWGASYGTAPISPDEIADPEGIELDVYPEIKSVPLGAPVRVNFKLVNTTADEPLPVPSNLSMKSGHISGKVYDPSGTERTFSTIIRCIEEEAMRILEGGKSITNSVTLLRGGQGTLFPTSGYYKVVIDVMWDYNGVNYKVTGETNFMITPPEDQKHARAATKILSTPDALLTLVFGGDHLKDGIEAIHEGIDNPVLRPHYALIEAKRIGNRFGTRKADLKHAADLLDKDTVMSPPEAKRIAKMFSEKKSKQMTKGKGNKISSILKDKLKAVENDEDTKKLLDSL